MQVKFVIYFRTKLSLKKWKEKSKAKTMVSSWNKAVFICLWLWMVEVWLCAEGRANSCVASWRRHSEIFHCQSIPWPWIRLTMHHSSLSPCSGGQIIGMFSQANRETLNWKSCQIKQCHCEAIIGADVVGRQNEWICLHILCGNTDFCGLFVSMPMLTGSVSVSALASIPARALAAVY